MISDVDNTSQIQELLKQPLLINDPAAEEEENMLNTKRFSRNNHPEEEDVKVHFSVLEHQFDNSSDNDENEEAEMGVMDLYREITRKPAQITAMISNFSTSYNVVNISMVLLILQSPLLQVDGTNYKSISSDMDGLCASALLAGMVAGQLLGGVLGDLLGSRIKAINLVVALQVFSSLGCAFLIWDYSSNTLGGAATIGGTVVSAGGGWTVSRQLVLWRFINGIGCGGVYPLAAVLSAEQEEQQGQQNQKENGQTEDQSISDSRPQVLEEQQKTVRECQKSETQKLKMITITFSLQGIGFLCAPLLTYFLLIIFGKTHLNIVWRIILGMGALPGLFLIYMNSSCCGNKKISVNGTVNRTSMTDTSQQQQLHFDDSRMETDDEKEVINAGLEMNIQKNEHKYNDEDEDHDITNQMEVPLEQSQLQERANHQQGLWTSIKSEPNLIRKLCGTAGTWLLFDFVFYGNTLFQPIVLKQAFSSGTNPTKYYDDDMNNNDNLHPQDYEFHLLLETTFNSLILFLIALPGYIVSIFFMNKRSCGGLILQTPRYIQIQGFALMAVLFTTIGSLWDVLTQGSSDDEDGSSNNESGKTYNLQWLLVLLYGSTFFFSNYGPNTTTFMLPSITFSEPCRSTLNGICAACGKLGALLGASLFTPLTAYIGDGAVMLFCAAFSAVACIITIACVRTDSDITYSDGNDKRSDVVAHNEEKREDDYNGNVGERTID